MSKKKEETLKPSKDEKSPFEKVAWIPVNMDREKFFCSIIFLIPALIPLFKGDANFAPVKAKVIVLF